MKEDDKINYFFLIYENYSKTGELNIIKLRETKIILNKLHFVENYENETMRLRLPKATDDEKIAFIQYIDQKIELFSGRDKYGTLASGKDFRIYYIRKGKEYYADNEKTRAYKSYFYISYINNTNNTYDYENIEYSCYFRIKNVFVSDSNVIIDFQNFCYSIYNYSIFIEYNITNYDEYSPLKKYLEKDIDINNNTKYYEFQNNGSGSFEILDSFKQGMIFVSIVGQDTEGFNRLVYNGTKYNYRIKEEESYLTIIIIVSVIGAICLLVVIICIIRCNRKKNVNEKLKDEKEMKLFNEKNEKESDDFKDNEKENDDDKDYGEKAYFDVNEKESADFKDNEKENADFKY